MVLGIVGSPRKGRLIDQLVMRTLEGVQSTGIEMSSDTIPYEVRGHELLRIIPEKEFLYFYVHLEKYLLEYGSSRLKKISFQK